MRKFSAALALILAALALTGCRPVVEDAPQRLSVYATFYPIYALTEAVLRDIPDAELHCLVQPQDGCLRNYQLSDWDAALLARGADAVMMGGRGLEGFESALFGWGDGGPAVCALLYNLELYADGTKAAEGESHLKGPNPHLYMSMTGAQQMLDSTAAMMVSLDPGYAAQYSENAQSAKTELQAAFDAARELLSDCEGRRVILMNEALVYCARDFGLVIADQVDRESGDALTGEALEKLIERLKNDGADIVLIERQAPQALVEALESANLTVAKLDVMSTHTEGEGFDVYLQILSYNARAMREAFDRASAGKDIA